jgi:hypothetical protein
MSHRVSETNASPIPGASTGTASHTMPSIRNQPIEQPSVPVRILGQLVSAFCESKQRECPAPAGARSTVEPRRGSRSRLSNALRRRCRD